MTADRLRRWWATLNPTPTGRRVPGTAVVAIVSLLLMYGLSLYVIGHGANMWYSDALSHLTIARRIVDSKAPGFQQLGTVWLPMPHLLLLVFVQNLWLWYTGWGAALLGMLCFAATSAAIWRTAARLGLGLGTRMIPVLVLWTSAGFLYAHTTALTEPVLIASMAGILAGLTHWAVSERDMSGGEIAVYIGVPAAVGVLSRYEGWVMALSAALFIVIVDWPRRRGTTPHPLRFTLLRRVLPALSAPAVGVVWWLAYNYALYGNPLEFMFGQYSAFAQQQAISEYGSLTTKGHPGLSLYVYTWSAWEVIGGVTFVVGLLGFAWLVWRQGMSTATLIVGVSLSTFVFEVLSLSLGQSVMNNDHSLPTGLFNVRYGVAGLLFFALGAGFAAEALRRALTRVRHPLGALAAPAVAVALIAQLGWWAQDPVDRNPMIGEGAYNQSKRPDAAAVYLRDHYQGGGILMDESASSSGIIPLVQQPIREYWNRSTGDLFEEAMDSPRTHAEWIFVNTQDTGGVNLDGRDAVYQRMLDHPQDYAGYVRVFATDTHAVYHLAW